MNRLSDTKELAIQNRVILSIDDDPNISFILSTVFQGRGYDVVSAPDGKTGLAKAIEIRPDLITLDISMPEMDGWLVLKELKRTRQVKSIPVVILSIFDEKKLGYDLGAFDYLVKPFEIDDIFSVVDRAVTGTDDDTEKEGS